MFGGRFVIHDVVFSRQWIFFEYVLFWFSLKLNEVALSWGDSWLHEPVSPVELSFLREVKPLILKLYSLLSFKIII